MSFDTFMLWLGYPSTAYIAGRMLWKGYRYLKDNWGVRRLKKITRLEDRLKEFEELSQSPTQAIGIIGEGLMRFLLFFFILLWLLIIAKVGVVEQGIYTFEDKVFATVVVLEIVAVFIAEMLVSNQVLESCRALKDPTKYRKMLQSQIKKQTHLFEAESV
ncbi:hypothetical protein OL229_09165 [Neisseriaceae bacterium JH1-16]|nr:hypothetical protein [Neisseriaceae bacterium JH1-16]